MSRTEALSGRTHAFRSADGTGAASPAEGTPSRGDRAQPFRRPSGGTIDRTRRVVFHFDGERIEGFAGDTIASALMASGRHMVARSFKYHRPRGIVGAGAEDPAALVEVGSGARRDPNSRATETEIFHGMEVASQNRWPSLSFDAWAVNDLFWRFMPAGFYYKTFMGPPASWMAFERLIRKAAGLGRAPDAPDPDRYEHVNAHCDVLVIGAGPAGLAAARAAARSGARVIVCEETPLPGGWLLSADPEAIRIDGKRPAEWAAETAAELAAMDEVRLLTRTTAFAYHPDNLVVLWEKVADHLAPADRDPNAPRQRAWRVRAREVVIATGAVERPLLFHQNDRPGIMLASAAATYAHRYGVLTGRRTAVFTNNDAGYGAALSLAAAGAEVAAVVDSRPRAGDGVTARAERAGIEVIPSAAVVGTEGRKRVKALSLMEISGAGQVHGKRREIAADCLAVSGGMSPNVALFSQSRGQLAFDAALGAFRPARSVQRERSAGSANGTFGIAACLAEGAAAGTAAASAAGFSAPAPDVPEVIDHEIGPGDIGEIREMPAAARKPRAWVDLQNDVTTKDLKLAVQEGYASVEHAKRYTTTGMGTDQGKTVNVAAFGVLADARHVPLPAIGTTTFRQPYKPVTFGAVAGQHTGAHFAPRRTTPMHAWHREAGAIFEPVGEWLRAWVYPKDGESPEEALEREARAARTAVGMLDASTLGKIDVRGKDARTFLNRVYTNAWSKLAPGRCRYGVMLNEDGMVIDDGVTSCLADDHFHMTTTTGGAARVLAHLEDYLQTEWTDLDVHLASVTEQWAVLSVCGPKSPELMEGLVDGGGMDPDGFPFMSWREAAIGGVPVRIFRISFTGETSYEINVPARYGLWLWEKVMAAGAPHGITPYGTEAMHLLRAEKGFIIVGQETDGTMTPVDLAMDWIVSWKKGDFIGKRSLTRSDTAREDRRQLVGLLTEDPAEVLAEGAHVIAREAEPAPPVPMLGHVTSSYRSPTLGRSIAMAVVKGGKKRLGERLFLARPGGGAPIPVTVTGTDFLALAEGEGAAAPAKAPAGGTAEKVHG